MKDYSYFFENSQLLNLFVAAFDDAFVYRYDAKTRQAKERIDVRYINGPKHRVLHDLSDRAKTLTLPVVTIEQTSLARDSSRIQNKDQFLYRKQLDSTNRLAKIPTPIPVNLELAVNIICYFKEDLDQIIKNFVVNCNPYIVVSWKFPEKFELPFLDEIRSEIQWSGDISYENPKDLSPDVKWRISASTSFTVKGWLFKDYNQTQAPIYVVNADFHALPVSNRFCDYNLFDAISAEGVVSDRVSISAYPEITNIFYNNEKINIPIYENIVIDGRYDNTFVLYGKRFYNTSSWYLSSGTPDFFTNYTEISTIKFPVISAYKIPDEYISYDNENIAKISFPKNILSSFGEFKFVISNGVAWDVYPKGMYYSWLSGENYSYSDNFGSYLIPDGGQYIHPLTVNNLYQILDQ
jgi:hypothetical protein